jgi:hypothetical protein
MPFFRLNAIVGKHLNEAPITGASIGTQTKPVLIQMPKMHIRTGKQSSGGSVGAGGKILTTKILCDITGTRYYRHN